MNRILLSLAAGLLLLNLAARAQEPATRYEKIRQLREQKAQAIKPEEPSGIEKKLLVLKDRQILQRFGQGVEGVFPVFGGLATGQGFAMGVQYLKADLAEGQLRFRTSGRVSIRASQKYNLEIAAPYLFDNRLELDFLSEYRNLATVDFYGLGPDSELADRTTFRLEDTNLNGTARFKPFRDHWLLGVTGGLLQVNTGPGQRSNVPSTEELFSPQTIPGLQDQTNFLRGGAFLQFDWRDNPGGARSGGNYKAELTYFDDRSLGRHDFRRLDLEVEQFIPFFNERRVIALHGLTTMTFANGADQSVPFYLKPWVGGPRTIRGFPNYRFYDDNLMVLNAEYRWEAFSGLDMALFLDAGKVVADRADLDFSDLETAAGFGFRFNIRNSTFLRLDFAFSHEGSQIWFRFGPPW